MKAGTELLYGLRVTGIERGPGAFSSHGLGPVGADDRQQRDAHRGARSDGEVRGVKDWLGVEDWPGVDVRCRAQTVRPPAGVGPEGAVLDLPEGRQLLLQRREGTATFTGRPLSLDELLHPYLGAAASVFNRWFGREIFHAGALVVGGRAWAVVGPREAGKSTLLAALGARGWPVLADDLVVTDGRLAFCGPRSLDLRQPVPGVTLPMLRARSDTRWRISLPPLPAAVPIGGWVYLGWGDAVAMTRLPASVLLGRLAARRSWAALPSDPETLLALTALPAWDLVRPPDWARMDESVDLVLQSLATVSPTRPPPSHPRPDGVHHPAATGPSRPVLATPRRQGAIINPKRRGS